MIRVLRSWFREADYSSVGTTKRSPGRAGTNVLMVNRINIFSQVATSNPLFAEWRIRH